jgi:heptosyltransferase-2
MQLECSERSKVSVQTDPGPRAPRVLILRAGAIGDTLMATPLVRALRRTFPDAYLVFVCSRKAYDMLRYNPDLDQVVPLAYRHMPLWLSPEKLRILRRLRGLNLDWALALESHSRLLDIVRRARVGRVVAFGALPQAERFERACFDPREHSIENYLRAAQPLGVQAADAAMELHYPPGLDDSLRQRLAVAGIHDNDLLVGIHPGWGGRQQPLAQTRLRSWPPERFAQVIQWLVGQQGTRVVLTGSSADRPLTEFIANLSAVPCLNLAGKLSLLELAASIRRLNAYLTVDSGPAHMAAALGTPLVTLWGPGIFEQTAPRRGRGPVQVLYHRVHCAPCYGTPLMKSCRDNICMKRIEFAEVRAAIEGLLGSEPSRGRATIPAQSGLRPPA